jgi:hypothetical protein
MIDEYDIIVNQAPYAVYNNTLCGLWYFKDRKVIAFSATSTTSIERVIHNSINEATVLKF